MPVQSPTPRKYVGVGIPAGPRLGPLERSASAWKSPQRVYPPQRIAGKANRCPGTLTGPRGTAHRSPVSYSITWFPRRDTGRFSPAFERWTGLPVHSSALGDVGATPASLRCSLGPVHATSAPIEGCRGRTAPPVLRIPWRSAELKSQWAAVQLSVESIRP